MLALSVKLVGVFFGFYALAAMVFLLVARLQKDATGNLLLNPNSWHFKVAYPFSERRGTLGLCHYFMRFLFMLMVAWPFIVVLESVKFVIYNALLLPFGSYSFPDIAEAYWDDAWLYAGVGSLHIRPFMPLYVIAPATYIWLYHAHRHATLYWTAEVGKWAGIVLAVIAFFVGLFYFTETDQEDVSLFREGLRAKWRRVCPLATIQER